MTDQNTMDRIHQLKAEKERLEAENRELSAANRLLRTHEDELRNNARQQYTQGLIDALVFAVRCNGVCGNDVELPHLREKYGRVARL